ncbi:hypothetical protein A3C26_04375 [Candidatus Daviesbacteria bacterium RIFCSPHIGHO2_02_FULL_39_12]|uniref:IstB-like ATP-binding domain-containing protein n=2 Tax=Candidatus Daviesiibacteriota TaxID=1752718 RepID=A0A1F5J8Y6_9BACT|nr:MAG: hypothetical protein A3C26_04375 [Candidatus Daviesbacteria bacterium RIFCSPHIGHO2_02_FULL_39_12]OGE71616.1 MAG: hypothetical protein A3H40_01245 [Candidatus Daviesbacteria bacterium RIFCSPLOWO2_02_FULL_38_15]
MSQPVIPFNELQKKLRSFKLSGMVDSLEIRLKEAGEDQISYSEFLGLLLEDFDFTFQPSIKKQEILEFATCHFLEKKANIVFIGQPGTGKIHLSVALSLQALGRGRTVLFTTVWDMINTLQQSRADYSYQKKIQTFLKPDLLILDELGYRSMAESTVEDFFEIVSKRYEKGLIIITSNRQIHQWDSVFVDKTLTTAVVDRLIYFLITPKKCTKLFSV